MARTELVAIRANDVWGRDPECVPTPSETVLTWSRFDEMDCDTDAGLAETPDTVPSIGGFVHGLGDEPVLEAGWATLSTAR